MKGTMPIIEFENGKRMEALAYTCECCGKESVGLTVNMWRCNWCGGINNPNSGERSITSERYKINERYDN
jgi:ribosomal protein L37AE/L43A